jgi:hypothetical protein
MPGLALIVVHGVFPGAVDADVFAGVEMTKTKPSGVTAAVVKGVIEGQQDIFPGAMSSSRCDAWKQDHKAVERQFATM